MKLSWSLNYHRLTPDEKKDGEKGTGYPDQNGVYVISETDDVKVAKYVGKGKIKENITRHKRDDEQNLKLKDLMQNRPFQYRIDFALIDNDEDMANAERSLFEHYGGLSKLYNKKIPEGNIVPINPPF